MGTARTGLKSRVTAFPGSSQAGFPHESSHCWERLCGHPGEIPLPRESLLVSLAQSSLPPSTVGSVLVSKLALGIQQCCSWTEHWGLHPACSTHQQQPEQGWEHRGRPGTAGQRGVPLQMMLCSKIKAQGKGEEGRMLCLWCLPSQATVIHAEPCSPGSRE